ncbi:hypothetical protein EXIGLDRAFT_828283 [Exidia glandulosa HHB12029]|uniref:Uncharacterized protein n=1 Tax=Exidia glandulosa HHB12029 TaxID=1314781 RepID=A0A166BVL0_EXIGL|nr:hypothetical protein EXIGLDRAFT_828283 [Exidia glandulosa HHB12029]
MATFYRVVTGAFRVGRIGEQVFGKSKALPDGTRMILLLFADGVEKHFKLGDLQLDPNATAST